MSNEGFASNIIRRARQSRHNVLLTSEEIEFILLNSDLTNEEKLLWLSIACFSKNDKSLSCTVEIAHLASVFKRPSNGILRALLRLKNMGYLQVAVNVPLSWFRDLRTMLVMMSKVKSLGDLWVEDTDVKDIKSVHCTLLLPNEGLMKLMKEPSSEPMKADNDAGGFMKNYKKIMSLCKG